VGGKLLVGLIVLGYLLPWTLFGLLVYIGDGFLHEMAETATPLSAFPDLIAPATVMIAGLYQLTPLKRSFMMRCRTPHAENIQSVEKKVSRAGAVKQGILAGGFCVGNCWSLMLLMSAIGQHRLDWMLALGCIMAAERLAPWGYRLARLVGLALVIWAALWVLI
jgi:predicted metal-binding membrane protein